ncbi:MAG TPA: inositol monophosphatase family protein [Miltoncostaeaceae bacterium]|nr:inositol monophosphatase family protein [Miltoncostaeaceae bacterium]
MAERDGPSTAAEAWLAPFRRACDRIAADLRALPPARRAEALGRGAGGDVTLLVDRVAEDAMVAELEALGRPLTLISEELGERDMAGGGPPVVVLDPIDGSLNAKRGFPGFATAVAVAEGRTMGDVTVALVRDHGSGEEFVAERGRGAWLDGAPLSPPPPTDGRLELLMVEGASPARVERAARLLDGRVRRLRAIGSLALSLCHTAAGRADAMAGLARGRSVDVAAAQLVAREAGVLVGVPASAALPGTPLDVTTRFHVLGARDEETLALLSRALAPSATAASG